MADNASELFLRGRYADAVAAWEEKFNEDQLDSVLLCNIATAYFEMELYRKCETQCEKALLADKKNIHARILKGMALNKRRKNEDAIAEWNVALTLTEDIQFIRTIHILINSVQKPVYSIPLPGRQQNDDSDNLKLESRPAVQNGDEKSRLVLKQAIDEVTYEKLVEASKTVAESGLVQAGAGNPEIDKVIALGYLQVNSGKLAEAHRTFRYVIESVKPVPLAAYLGEGTAFALSGKLDDAVELFSTAIRCYTNSDDAWKRRGQARAAQGNIALAISDLTQAIAINHDPDTYLQRGLVYYKQLNYRRSAGDFDEVIKREPNNAVAWNQRGLCYTAQGYPWDAIECHQKALLLSPTLLQATVFMGQAYKEWGKFREAFDCYTRAIEMAPDEGQCYFLRGQASFSVGDHHNAIEDFYKAIELDPRLVDCRRNLAVSLHGVGWISKAIEQYNILQDLSPFHVSWYNREIALYLAHHFDDPIDSFHLDRDLNPYFKEYWCKREDPRKILNYNSQKPLPKDFKDVENIKRCELSEDVSKLLDAATLFGPKLQYQCPGFMANKRQWKMCGMAVIDVAQHLKRYWESDSNDKEFKDFGWRRMFEIIVRWRQYSEPNDPVVWVDLLSQEQFEEGFGSHTPMVAGQTYVVRYSPYYYESFPLMKQLFSQTGASEVKQREMNNAKSLEEAYVIAGSDFYVCTPCESTANPGKIYEGTRLTLQFRPPEGFEYSIRTPGTPPRWREYTEELDFCFKKLTEAVRRKEQNIDEISDWILTITFYWYNFMPLARGTAACGYIGLLGMFLAIGIEIQASIPDKVQVDWIGILNRRPKIFIDKLKPWMYPARVKYNLLDNLPLISTTLPTLRKRIEALNCD